MIFEDGTRYGKILRLHDYGGGDIVEIVPEGKGQKASVLVPFTKEMVPTVDMTQGILSSICLKIFLKFPSGKVRKSLKMNRK